MAPPRFSSAYRTVILLGRSAGLPLLPEDCSRLKRLFFVYYQILVDTFVVFKLFCAVYAITHNEKFEEVIFGAATLMFTMTGALLTLFYTWCGSEFKSLTEKMDRVGGMMEESGLGREEYLTETCHADSRLLSLSAKLMAMSTIISPLFFSFSVPVLDLVQGTYRTHMALPTHCSFEFTLSAYYEIFVLLEFLGLVYPAIQKLGNEFLMLGLYKLQGAHFKYLAETMRELGQSAGPGMEEKLLSWIRLHQEVLRNAHELIAFFSPIVVLYYGSIICIVAGGVFYQLNAKDANVVSATFLGMYMLITVVHLYIQCQLAEELTVQGEKLAEEVYSIPWYRLDAKNKGFVKLIINMTNRPIHVVAYRAPTFTLNKESFVAFMTNTISAYMGFSRVMQINE